MQKVIDRNIRAFICVVSLVYFMGIALYSFLPEITDITKEVLIPFYWINNTIMTVSITFGASLLLIDKKAKVLVRGVSILLLILGIFQIAKSLGIDFHYLVWCGFLLLYLLITQIVYRHDRQRNYEK